MTTDHALAECWLLIGSCLRRRAATEFWDASRAGIARMAEARARDLDRGREIVERFPDQTLSLVDATSFAVMEREEIERAFDMHFRVYRFGKASEPRFDVVPT